MALSGLIFWGVVIALVAMLGMKVVPEVIEYYKIKKKRQGDGINASGKTVAGDSQRLRQVCAKSNISRRSRRRISIFPRKGNDVVIAFAYEKRIPLFYNVSLLIDFEGSSSG